MCSTLTSMSCPWLPFLSGAVLSSGCLLACGLVEEGNASNDANGPANAVEQEPREPPAAGGRWLAFEDEGLLVAEFGAEGEPRTFRLSGEAFGGSHLRWSPDGQRLAFDEGFAEEMRLVCADRSDWQPHVLDGVGAALLGPVYFSPQFRWLGNDRLLVVVRTESGLFWSLHSCDGTDLARGELSSNGQFGPPGTVYLRGVGGSVFLGSDSALLWWRPETTEPVRIEWSHVPIDLTLHTTDGGQRFIAISEDVEGFAPIEHDRFWHVRKRTDEDHQLPWSLVELGRFYEGEEGRHVIVTSGADARTDSNYGHHIYAAQWGEPLIVGGETTHDTGYEWRLDGITPGQRVLTSYFEGGLWAVEFSEEGLNPVHRYSWGKQEPDWTIPGRPEAGSATDGAWRPKWFTSPDGSLFVATRTVDGATQLWVLDLRQGQDARWQAVESRPGSLSAAVVGPRDVVFPYVPRLTTIESQPFQHWRVGPEGLALALEAEGTWTLGTPGGAQGFVYMNGGKLLFQSQAEDPREIATIEMSAPAWLPP